MPRQFPYAQLDISGGIQAGTSHLLRKKNEVALGTKNVQFNSKIGSAKRRLGYEQTGRTIQQGNDSLYGGVYRYDSNNKIISGINNAANTAGTLKALDTGDYWTDLITNAPANIRFNCLNDLNDLYVCGANDVNQFMPLTNVSNQLVASTTRNVFGAPASKFIAEYNGDLYAINCYLNGKYYPDRFYVSSPALGAITFVQTAQSGLLNQLRVDTVKYLKAGMTVDIYSAGTEAKVVASLNIVSVDKPNNRITFNPTQLAVKDNDEIWLSGTKGTLSRFWNTDYKTPETADWERVPPGKENSPAFTAHGKNNNRLFLFTKDGFYKWDGGQLITVSTTVGCVSHETVQNIGSWTLWLHTSGVWGYNDNTGQLKLLSRAIQPFIEAINQTNLGKTSAVVSGRVYKLALSELLPLEALTTSTSTSSTSTSSTSSSTSSTSTSSTSTSSTSTSTSSTTITTSTSSTSSSTSSTSTSVSSTSTSFSTSSTSTSTSTVATPKQVARMAYDFDLNSWWPEEHTREIRFQFMHTMNGYTKPYFTDDTGRLFRDETGNQDHLSSIPMVIDWGRSNLGVDQKKIFNSVLVDSEKADGASLQYSIDGGAFHTLPQTIDKAVSLLRFPQTGQLIEGRDIDYKLVHNEKGESPIINGLTTFFSASEAMPSETS